MNKSDLIEVISKQADVSKPVARTVLDSLLATVTQSVAKGDSVSVAGLGTFGPSEPVEITAEENCKQFERRLHDSKASSSKARAKRLASAMKKPRAYQVILTVFERNADVVVEVLSRANGCCEGCGSEAPFLRRSDNSPYLEVHHPKPLSDGGDDCVENAIGLCPNCHRKAHFGK
jgi:5-methylcytosine-specific restriction protein A